MSATALVVLVAAISGVDGGSARIEAGLAHGLRPGDTGRVYYELTVGGATRRVEVGSATVIDAGEMTATCAVPAGETRAGFLIEFEVPADRAGADGMLDRARSRLPALPDDELEDAVRLWIDRLIPPDPRVEETVVRVLRQRHLAQLGEGRPAPPPAAPTSARSVMPNRDQVLIPGRVYLVGVDLREAEFYSQQPRFAVELDPFLMDARPVFKVEFLAHQADFVFADPASREATGVTWSEADAYCSAQGLRLPTEFEWEIAMKTAGMDGDLLEWTASWYEPYPGNQIPEAEYGRTYRVVRGAASGADFDVHRRRFVRPDSRHPKLGFRCAGDPNIAP